jgi:hypothetical protein
MRGRSCWLLVLLAACAGRELPGESDDEVGWTPEDDVDIGPVYVLAIEERNDDSARVHVVDVGEPGGEGEQAVVLDTLGDIKSPRPSPSGRWMGIPVGMYDGFPMPDDIYLIDFSGAPLEPARAIERPDVGYFFYDYWFAGDDSGLATLFVPASDDGLSRLYYVPLLESGPLPSIEVPMPDERRGTRLAALSDDGRWLVFFGESFGEGADFDGLDGIYVSEIVDGQPTTAVLIHETTPGVEIGTDLRVAGGAAFFETHDPLRRLHRIDLESLELQTLTEPEPEPFRWYLSTDGSRVLDVRGPDDTRVVDYVEIVDGEPLPAVPLSLGDETAHAKWADFLAPDGSHAFAEVFVGDADVFVAWYDFDGPTPAEPVGMELASNATAHEGTWAASPTPDGRVLLLGPSAGFVDVVELPPPWHAMDVDVHASSTRVEIGAIEGPPSDDLPNPLDGIWTLRTGDEPGPPVRFAHPLQGSEQLPLDFNVEYVPTSERHYFVEEGGEKRAVWENDGHGGGTQLLELEGHDFALFVVAPQL